MNLRPIGDRILIRPLTNDDTKESGIILVEHRKPETMGTVIAVGTCAHPLRSEAEAVYAEIANEEGDTCDDDCVFCRAADLLLNVTRREPSVKVGDTVIFSWTAGREVQIDDTGDRYLILRESDIEAVLEGV